MITLFVAQYILGTIIAIVITERYVPRDFPWVWHRASKFERYIACLIPIYREIIVILVLRRMK